jgi:ABC-type sugar transport system permease subunit
MVFAFLAPAISLYLGFVIAPAIQAFYLSFFETSGFGDNAKWVGLRNYVTLMTDSVFWLSVANMLTILVVGGLAVFGFAFLFTMLISSGLRGKKLLRALIFLPSVIAVIAITTFWSFIFVPRYGLLTNFFKSIGLDSLAKVVWTAPENVFWAMLVGLVWVFVGFFTILILAGADKIPTDMFEAARLEGASNRQIFRLITLPMIWDVILITQVLWVIEAIKIMEFPYAFGGPGIGQNLYTPAVYLYIMGFGQRHPVYQLGYATAIGVAMFLFTVVIVFVIGMIARRERVEY